MANSLVLNGVEIPGLSDVLIGDVTKKVRGEILPSLLDSWLNDEQRRLKSKMYTLAKGVVVYGDAPYVDRQNKAPALGSNSSFTAKSVEIPYFKLRREINPHDLLDEATTSLIIDNSTFAKVESLSQAYAILTMTKMKELAIAYSNTKRKMLAEVFTTGKLVIKNTDHAIHRTIDFERDATATYVPALVWSNGAADVVGDIKEMINIYRDLNDRSPQVMIMRSDVYAAMIANSAFKAEFITPYAGLSIPNLPATLANDDRFGNLAMQLRGLSGGSLLDVWTYDANYTDKSGTKQYMLPQGGVYFTEYPSETSNFTAKFSPIENFNALSYDASSFFTQILPKDDGSLVEILSEQGMLIVPNNVNSVVGGANFTTI